MRAEPGSIRKSEGGTLLAILSFACLTNPRVRIGRGPVRAQRPDPVLFSFANLRTARFLQYSHLRVSPIRVCGLGGVRFALNGRTPFCFFVTETRLRICPRPPLRQAGTALPLGIKTARGNGRRTSLSNRKSPPFAAFHGRKQGGLAEIPPPRPAWDQTPRGAGTRCDYNRATTSDGRRPAWSSRTC